ncbi:MAG: folylpolyglutamate synthase/dihydrofolate synthase family protein [Ginsengibacter sp.]
MTYEQTLHYLYHKLPLYSNVGIRAYKADLKNTIALCYYLGDPQNKIKTIHIAGTNGKGSTSHMLAAVLQGAGYKTGLYTSPHLKDFRERIKVNGEMVEQKFIVEYVKKIKSFSEEIEPSFFELTFVMALEYFARQKTDIAIIETGLGGRLDSTNVITPELSVITNISFDHMDILGGSLDKIAFEKAGIIKPGVPVVIGETIPETKIVFQKKAKETASPIIFAEDKYEIISATSYIERLDVTVYNTDKDKKEKYSLDLNGVYQQKNLTTVLSAIDVIRNKFTIPDEEIIIGLRNVKNRTGLYGRWDVIYKNPLIVLDVAHNEEGIKQLVNQIKNTKFSKLHVVFGIVKDKEVESVLANLPGAAKYYFTKAQIARALPEEELNDRARKFQLYGSSYTDVNVALRAAVENASPDDMIVVCGSVFVVGEVDVTNINPENKPANDDR